MIGKTLLAAAAAIAFASAAQAQLSGPSGTSALAGGQAGGVRFRSFDLVPPPQGSDEIYLGRGDLGQPANRVAGNGTYGTSNAFTFAYDSVTDVLSVTALGSTLNFNGFQAGLTGPLANKSFNRLQLSLRDSDQTGTDSTVGVSNLVLNGNALTPASITAPGNGLNTFYAIGGDFRESFTLTGSLDLSGDFTPFSQEGSRLEIGFGSNGVPEPAAWAMMIGGFGLVGAASRRRTRMMVTPA